MSSKIMKHKEEKMNVGLNANFLTSIILPPQEKMKQGVEPKNIFIKFYFKKHVQSALFHFNKYYISTSFLAQ